MIVLERETLEAPATLDASMNDWVSEDCYPRDRLSDFQWRILTNHGSLTKYLRNLTDNQIEHNLRFAEWNHPILDESIALQVQSTQVSWIREMEWRFQHKTWVFGRVVIPKFSLSEENQALLTLNEKSLGELLFSDPDLKRGPFELCQLSPKHYYYQSACLHAATKPKYLWARRSTFQFHQLPVLVNEIFFPEFFEHLEAHSVA